MEKKFSNMENVYDTRGIVITANIYYYKCPASVGYFSKGLRSLHHLLLKRPESSCMSIIPNEVLRKQSLRADLPCAPQIIKWRAKAWPLAHLMQSLCSWELSCLETLRTPCSQLCLKKKKVYAHLEKILAGHTLKPEQWLPLSDEVIDHFHFILQISL